jgi:hypothetical protein
MHLVLGTNIKNIIQQINVRNVLIMTRRIFFREFSRNFATNLLLDPQFKTDEELKVQAFESHFWQ